MAIFSPSEFMKDAVEHITNVLELLEHERVTQGKKTITTDHSAIHSGLAFGYATKFTVAAGASAYLEVLTPAEGYVHWKPSAIQTDAPKILVQLIEAPTTTPGTPVTSHNRRRVGTPPASTVTLRLNPTGVSGGTVIDQDYVGGGSGAGNSSVSGGLATNDNEWVLAQGTLYVIKVTNGGSGSADVGLKVFYYVEPSA